MKHGLLQSLDKEQPKKRTFYFVRHGETNLNKDGKIRAWLDVGLDEKGFDEARATGRKLKDRNIDMIITSDLTRTLQTAACISEETGIPIVATTMALRPLNVGDFSGKDAKNAAEMIIKYAVEKPEENIPGGESFDSFKYRSIIGLIALLNEYANKKILVVSHHRNDRLFHAWIEAGCPNDLELDLDAFSDWEGGISPGDLDEFTFTSDYLV